VHAFVAAIKVGDIVYIKSFSPSSLDIIVRGVGVVVDNFSPSPEWSSDLVQIGRNVQWRFTEELRASPAASDIRIMDIRGPS
jgi:predicted Mrr-cat superfamily restriction endonuclease